MPAYVYFFTLTDICNEQHEYAFPARSKQMAWLAAAGYVACHTLNPAIKAIALVGEKRIVEIAIEPNEVSQVMAAGYVQDPRVRD